MNKVICFHGTNETSASAITENGFKEGTFFAKHLEDALMCGGRWVFEVCFDKEETVPRSSYPPASWQFIIHRHKSPTDIVCLTHYAKTEQVYENSDLRKRIFESNLTTKGKL